MLREVIAKELIQELPLLLASGGVGTAVKAGIRGGAYVGRQAGKEFAEETVKQVSQSGVVALRGHQMLDYKH